MTREVCICCGREQACDCNAPRARRARPYVLAILAALALVSYALVLPL